MLCYCHLTVIFILWLLGGNTDSVAKQLELAVFEMVMARIIIAIPKSDLELTVIRVCLFCILSFRIVAECAWLLTSPDTPVRVSLWSCLFIMTVVCVMAVHSLDTAMGKFSHTCVPWIRDILLY